MRGISSGSRANSGFVWEVAERFRAMVVFPEACTEMVMPMPSSKDNSMFRTYDYNYAAFEEGCRPSFGVKPRPSVLKNISDTIVALLTEEGAHRIDLRASTPNDPDWLVQLRESEIGIIQGLLDDYYQDLGRSAAYSSM
ncbi:Lysosomal Pro-X carboxypeptidase-like protein [Drosera capensis]